jgi:hypothetical protein
MVEGHDWSQPPFTVRRYFVPWGRAFWATFLPVTCLYLGTYLAAGGTTSLRDFLEFAVMVAIGSASLAAGLALFIHRLAYVQLTPDSVKTWNDMSIRQTMRLEDIERAWVPQAYFGWFVLVKSRRDVLRLYIPTFLSGWSEFRDSVRQVTPVGHPLRTAIESVKK